MILLVAAITALMTPRSIVDLNHGWEFIRLPESNAGWSFPDAVPTSSWKVVSSSSEETARENGRAINAIDGNPNTIWHTEWSKTQPGYPHFIVIDLGSNTECLGFRLLNRQTSPFNGRPAHVEVALSDAAGGPWRIVLASPLKDSPGVFEGRFLRAGGRFLRVAFDAGIRPDPFLAISEIGLIRVADSEAKTSWESQYNIARVQIGDARFDLHGADLERIRALEMGWAAHERWEPATLPHSPWIRPLGSAGIWQGVTYYRRKLAVPGALLRKHLELTIEGAMQVSDLWINGKHVGGRRGGYLPLIADLTGILRAQNDVLVRVDNSDNPLVPPGKPQQDLDFMYGCGIYRNAYLTATDPLRITNPLAENLPASGGIYVTTGFLDRDVAAVVDVRTHVRNGRRGPAQVTASQQLLDSMGHVVATKSSRANLPAGRDHQFFQQLELLRPEVWTPDDPNLYRLVTTLSVGGKVVDQEGTTVGIRKIEVSRERGFVLNGKPLRLIGTNRHQDYPWIGIALSDEMQVRDAILIKKSGHNIVRLSHYPQSPAFMDACDRLGILTIPCIPGWQFMNNDPRFVALVKQDIRELVRRDRNHPSVAFFEASLNETYPTKGIAQSWDQTAKEESVDGRILTAGDALTGATWDIAYNQWQEGFHRPQDSQPDKPGYIREYGDYEFGGALSSSRVAMGRGMDALLQETWNHTWSLNRYWDQYPWTMGYGTWVMFDHNVPWSFSVSACGLADLFRRPKPSFWFFASQTRSEPILKAFATQGSLVVFTNCDQVDLVAAGQPTRRSAPSRGASTDYAATHVFDGSNTEHLPHPPIVFHAVPRTFTLVGYRGGKRVASQKVGPSAAPTRLKLEVDDQGIPLRAGGSDAVFVRASVVDANGSVCESVKGVVRFEVSGTGSIAGEPSSPLELGVASSLVRSGSKGALVVRARWGGVSGSMRIQRH